MKPYYEQDGITIYYGDCREVLPGMRADSVLTDPPYGIGLDYDSGPDDWRPGTDLWRLVFDAMDDAGLMTATVSSSPLPSWMAEIESAGFIYHHCSVYWNKCRAGGNHSGRYAFAWEPILHYGKVPRSGFKLASRMLSDVYPHVGAKTTDHPAERDRGTWTKLLTITPGELVLDPFMGSGTTLVAAKQLGRKAIGIELSERYCEIAAKRLAQGVLDFGEAS